MVYGKPKKNNRSIIVTIIGSVIVGVVVLILDYLAHSTIGNAETFYYYLAKPFIAGYIAFFAFKGIFSFKLKKGSLLFYSYYATLFALVHGIYYRIIDFVQGKPFFDRVGDIVIGSFTLSGSNIFIGTLSWLVIHGGVFLIGIGIAKLIVRKL